MYGTIINWTKNTREIEFIIRLKTKTTENNWKNVKLAHWALDAVTPYVMYCCHVY
jgi:hypothetical protein